MASGIPPSVDVQRTNGETSRQAPSVDRTDTLNRRDGFNTSRRNKVGIGLRRAFHAQPGRTGQVALQFGRQLHG
jgi:hypothetical protein